MKINKSGDPDLSPNKREFVLFFKCASNVRNRESNMQFRSVQLGRESTDIEKDSYTSFDDSFIAECSSPESSIHKHLIIGVCLQKNEAENWKAPSGSSGDRLQ